MKNGNNINIEEHPNWYYDIPVMDTLILGSYPPHPDKRNYEFYYPNKRNHFWKILAAIYTNYQLTHFDGSEAVQERKRLMEGLKIGVQNIGKTISRIRNSSLDTNISIIEYNDIISILKKHPELKLIILPGFSAKSSTYHGFCNYLKLHNIAFSAPVKPSHGLSFSFTFDKREIKCIICTSTSTATKIKLESMIDKFKEVLRFPV